GQMPAFASACQHIQRGRRLVEPFPWLLQPAAALPGLKGWGQIEEVLLLSDGLCLAGADAQRAGDGLAPALHSGAPAPALLAALQSDAPALRDLGAHAGQAANYLLDLDPTGFVGPLGRLRAPLEQLEPLVPALQFLRDTGPAAPALAASLLGGDSPRTYLVLAQDNAEPRATGGFIGVMGPLEVSSGNVVQTEFRSSYDWDNLNLPRTAAPAPLARYMNLGVWYLRDANWSPDFVQTAATVQDAWQRNQGQAVDGVVAVDLPALDDMLNAVGGVDVPELGGFVTAGTAEQRIAERRNTPEALASYDAYQRVKSELLGALYKALLAKLEHPDAAAVPAIASALLHDLATKHIMLSLADPGLARVARTGRWDGHIPPPGGDALGIVDTSVSYGKTGPYIHKSARYQRDASGIARVLITYSNSYEPIPGAPWDPFISGLYWDWKSRAFVKQQGAWLDYLRILLPAGIELRSSSGTDDQPTVSQDLPGLATLAAPVLVLPGQQRQVTFEYQLPAAAAAAPLTVIAQPGASPYSLEFQVTGLPGQTLMVDGRDLTVQ
ncbi:MAG TPA: DUF4012 domain-containing protein, partial [Chloroflexota bacterium]|nr:DUF4012 domain-containing protein [Chloroflexota bacterium]